MSAAELTRHALPYYTLLPGLAMVCHACSGVRDYSHTMTLLYLLSVEGLVFLDHYFILHRWKHMHHHIHHRFRTVNAWVAFAFHPLDGLSQGMPLLYAAILPVSWKVVYATIFIVGVWTIYIHTKSRPLPFPFMGCDYHLVHHEKNWYNFGLFTIFFDWMFGTLKTPNDG